MMFLLFVMVVDCHYHAPVGLQGNIHKTLMFWLEVYHICFNNNFLCKSSLSDSGCLFPSLPSDVKYDQNTGISFICDLNDNVEASWPTTSSLPASLCNKSRLQCNSLHCFRNFILHLQYVEIWLFYEINVIAAATQIPAIPKATYAQSGKCFLSLLGWIRKILRQKVQDFQFKIFKFHYWHE